MIEIKNEDQIRLIDKACKIVAETLILLKESTKPGLSTGYIDEIAYKNIIKNNSKPGFLGFEGYPKTICISLNEEVIHGIPDDKKIIKEGDVVSIDLGAIYEGYYGDAAITFIAGEPKSKKHTELVKVCEDSLYKGIEQVRNGARLGDVSYAIGEYVFEHNMDVLREFTGHGIGRNMHEDPPIFNYGIKNTGPILRTGMTISIEPMITLGSADVYILSNKWTVVTRDKSYGAHFEHTVCVRDNGCDILTKI